MSSNLVDAIPSHLARTRADSYASEVLPLLAACKFLEQQARSILRPKLLGKEGLPLWLPGVHTTIERVPFGVVLIIAPANYPLLLPGVQALQALAAGNAVVWKPGETGAAVAHIFAQILSDSGLPEGLLSVTGDSRDAAINALEAAPDKVVFTGSVTAGKAILARAANLLIPVVAELSGCDAVIVLPSADPERVLDALLFGMRFNGSATCMAPRRLFLVGDRHQALLATLRERFSHMDPVPISTPQRDRLIALLDAAQREGATVNGDLQPGSLTPILLDRCHPHMSIAQADIFAPVLAVLHAADEDEVVAMDQLCPFGLTAAIFGNEKSARSLAARLNVGTVIINDLIVPTADPRVPFGGRRHSGFGVTRGAEGLLEMTSLKTIAVRTGNSTHHYQPTGQHHESLFAGLTSLTHSHGLRAKLRGLRTLLAAAARLNRSTPQTTEKQ